jgi:catechol 2,3-dioxygenase-like lactoylglutathione lyase family enzyme
MPESLTIAHVTLTVSDLDRSVPWYERVFDIKLVLDEEPGPFRRAVWVVRGQTPVGLHQFPDPGIRQSRSRGLKQLQRPLTTSMAISGRLSAIASPIRRGPSVSPCWQPSRVCSSGQQA